MAKKNFWLATLVLALVFGLMVVGCGEDEPEEEPYVPPPPQPGANANNPIDRVENTNLGTMTSSVSGWQQLLASINSTGKYINLDLSACTMTGTAFNPDSTVDTGKKYIVSIILPTVATSIEEGASSNSAFKNFTNLKSISGANIITIGDYSFASVHLQNVEFPKATTIGKNAFSSTYLESVNFPLVTTISESAFYSSTQLKNANFPAVQTIGEDAFMSCSDLESITFPASAEIGFSSEDSTHSNPFTYCGKLVFTLSGSGNLSVIENGKALVRNSTILLAYPSATGNITMNTITALDGKVFQGRYYLDSVTFPQLTSIGSSAFYYCSNIQDVNFPLVTSIGSGAFSNCSRLQSASFPEVTTIGSSAFFSCSNLLSLNIPRVTKIDYQAFFDTGETTLTITMGSAAPTLGSGIFIPIGNKTVKVKVPAGATGYSPFTGSSVTVSGANSDVNWANGFRGKGWNGFSFTSQYASIENISVTIEPQ